MSILIDFLALAIIAICVFIGYKKGFIKSVMGLVSLIVSIIIAINFYGAAAGFIKERFVEPYFVDQASDKFSAMMKRGSEVVEPEEIFEEKPADLVNTSARFGINIDDIKDFYEKEIKGMFDPDDIESISDEISRHIVDATVTTVSTVLGFIVVFIASMIVLSLLQWLLNFIFKLPVLKTANKLFGIIFGALKGVLLVMVLVNIAFIFSKSDTSDESFLPPEAVEESMAYTVSDIFGLIFD